MSRSSRPSARVGALGALLALLLAGCATAPRAVVAPNLPPMPSRLAAACTDPGVKEGEAYILLAARTRKALATCSRKQKDGVAFYDPTTLSAFFTAPTHIGAAYTGNTDWYKHWTCNANYAALGGDTNCTSLPTT